MLILNPERVRFGERTWANVAAVAIEREAVKVIHEIGDGGPHATFVDVPEQKCTIVVTQHLAETDLDTPSLGSMDALVITTGISASDAGRMSISVDTVVVEVKVTIARGAGATRRITLLGVSGDGASDPLQVAPAELSA